MRPRSQWGYTSCESTIDTYGDRETPQISGNYLWYPVDFEYSINELASSASHIVTKKMNFQDFEFGKKFLNALIVNTVLYN